MTTMSAKRHDPRWRVALTFAPDDPRLLEVQRSAELGRTGLSDRILELARAGLLAEHEFRTARLPRHHRPGAEVRILGACTANVRVRLSIERDRLLADHLRDWVAQNNRPAAARLLRLLELGILVEGARPVGAASASTSEIEEPVSRQPYRDRPAAIGASDTAPCGTVREHDRAAEIHRAMLAASW